VQPDRPRRTTATGVIASLAGLALFAWFVRRIGPAEIWSNVRQVGWGLAGIVLIAGMRFAVRAIAWAACVEPPHRLPIRDALAAVVCGDTFGNLTPLGPIVGEPAKAAYVRSALPLAPAITSLAIENLAYTLSAAAMIGAAMIALVFSFDLPARLLEASELMIAIIAVSLGAAAAILWMRPAILSRAVGAMLPQGGTSQQRIDRVRDLEQQIYTFSTRRPAALAAVAAFEVLFHALGVLEVHVTWWLMMGAPPPILTSFVLEGANRMITVVFKIVPLRLGVDEMGTAAFTQLLGYGAAPGGSLAIVRKARVVFWTLIGTALLVRRGLSPRRIAEGSQTPISR
jgi:hypothetical protein